MRRRPRVLVTTAALATSMALLVTACGNSSSDGEGGGNGSKPAVTSAANSAIADITGSIKGSGATFPDAFYQEAVDGLASVAPDLSVTYEAIGSSSGREQFAQGLNDFAGTDSLVKDGENISDFSYIPTTAASIAVTYNLAGVDALKLDGSTIAKIFQAQVTTWNDPAIAELNPGVDLPSTKITVARRSDGSGTTKNFTKFLDAAAPNDWKLGSDDTVEWPASTEGGQQNPGVAQIVTDTEGAIGYVDFGNAKELKMRMASIKNADGEFVAPSIEGTQAALAGAQLGTDLTYDPLHGPGKGAYPITAPTYILVHNRYEDAAKGKAVVAFVSWLITDGADSYASSLGYAPLPKAFRDKALAALDAVEAS